MQVSRIGWGQNERVHGGIDVCFGVGANEVSDSSVILAAGESYETLESDHGTYGERGRKSSPVGTLPTGQADGCGDNEHVGVSTMSNRLKLVDRLVGRGQLLREPSAAIPVHYDLAIRREMLAVGRTGDEVEGLFRVEGSVSSDEPSAGLELGVTYGLVLEDGAKLSVFLSSTSLPGTHWKLAVQDAEDLVGRYN